MLDPCDLSELVIKADEVHEKSAGLLSACVFVVLDISPYKACTKASCATDAEGMVQCNPNMD